MLVSTKYIAKYTQNPLFVWIRFIDDDSETIKPTPKRAN